MSVQVFEKYAREYDEDKFKKDTKKNKQKFELTLANHLINYNNIKLELLTYIKPFTNITLKEARLKYSAFIKSRLCYINSFSNSI